MADGEEQTTEERYARSQLTSAQRLRSPIIEAHRWRLVAVLALVGFLSTTGSTIFFAYRRTVDLVVITVDEDNHMRAVGKPEVPEDRQILAIKGHLSQVVEWVRTIPADGDLLKLNWKRAMLFMSPDGARMLQQYGREMRPDELQKQWRIRVQVNDVQPVTRESYFVEWEERFYRLPDMSFRHAKRYRTVVTFYLDPPMQDSEEARLNWLGVKIRDVTWYRQPDINPKRPISAARTKPTQESPE
jgi:type IV secretory pathway TrbF-like protein